MAMIFALKDIVPIIAKLRKGPNDENLIEWGKKEWKKEWKKEIKMFSFSFLSSKMAY